MVVDRIQANYDDLEVIAARFGQWSEASSELHQRVQRCAEELASGWEGLGADSFVAEMSGDVLPALQRLQQVLEAAQSRTREAALTIRRAEEEAARLFTVQEVMTGAMEENSSAGRLKAELYRAMAGWGTDEDAIFRAVARASDAEIRTVSSDASLMARIRSELTDEEYTRFLVTARIFSMPQSNPLISQHLSPAEADAAIRQHLGPYIEGAVKAGRKISGQVAVVRGTDWDLVGQAEFGDRWSRKRLTVNGFVDRNDRVWINADRGNAGTMIHEALHKYGNGRQSRMHHTSFGMSEGVTEYFTHITLNKMNVIALRENIYPERHQMARSLVQLVGEDVVARAYFDQDMEGLHAAYTATGKSQQDWERLIADFNAAP